MADARNTALTVLNKLDAGHQILDTILDELAGANQHLSRRDQSLLNALIYGVLRWRARLDYIVSHFSNIPIKKIEPTVLNILRLALFQIIYLDRIPVSAAVNTSVALAAQRGAMRATAFVNALLRKAAEGYSRVPFPAFEDDAVAFVSVVQSLPSWIARRWLKRFNKETIIDLCKTINSIPPNTIRTNTLKTTRDKLILALKRHVEHIEPTMDAPQGVKMINLKQSIPALAAFKNGWFQVQDEAAQLVSLLLDPQPGESVLDACAGRGGKTAHIAQLMQTKGSVTAADRDAKKLRQLDAEMQRLGLSSVHTVCRDLNSPLDPKLVDVFDRILLDAPCSGLGVLRRNPDIKWNSTEVSLRRHADIQKRLLSNLAPMAKPGGILVYSVCSIEPEENEAVIHAFLKKHPEFVIDNNTGKLPERIRSAVEPATGFKTLPLFTDMDGFYFARLKKIN